MRRHTRRRPTWRGIGHPGLAHLVSPALALVRSNTLPVRLLRALLRMGQKQRACIAASP